MNELTMKRSAVSTLRRRAIEAMGGMGGWTVEALAAKLEINRPDFSEALAEAGFPVCFRMILQ